ncbi:FtsK/SpoIIIE domain-containing protein [uncultured Cellulomonas sp.]|uniref:FtsK/SpoIIIE domain-containing protein n=1 Tax=uncultured Cellulomonas sp. TaxID=189682 RepID=UPI00260956AB|nr:FtsK/SpoIIIE domain-containing protein [uncultured Cellulomonas sp.]
MWAIGVVALCVMAGSALAALVRLVPLSLRAARVALRQIFGAMRWVSRHRRFGAGSVVVAVVVWMATKHGVGALAVGAAISAALLATWRLRAPETFSAWVTERIAGSWRSARVYRPAWETAMVTTGLDAGINGERRLPALVGVRSRAGVDRVRVRMLAGQVLEDWTGRAPRLAQTFGVPECRVRTVPGRSRDLELWLLVADMLLAEVSPFRSRTSDAAALAVAVQEDGRRYRLRLLGSHVLVVGATGSGKGSVLWAIVAGLAPAIRDRTARVWALDPKGGMELAAGRPLFDRFVYGDPDDGGDYEIEFARALEDAVSIMRRRQARLRGITRLHSPTEEEPLIVVLIDELANLTAYITDREAKRRIGAALSLLLSQGRAVGVSVVGAVQDPRKEVVTVRDLFPTRIALRLSEADQVALVLGAGARDRGARCDRIAESMPGTGYVGIEGVAEPLRVRFPHFTDQHIDALVAEYGTSADMTAAETRSAA